MTGGQVGVEVAKAFFTRGREGYVELAGAFVDDPEAAVDAAEALFDSMIPGIGYLETPQHPMASSVFWCSAALAVYLALASRDVDVHDFGAAMLEQFARTTEAAGGGESEEPTGPEESGSGDAFRAAAEASQRETRPGEFVFEVVTVDDPNIRWAMNINSCAICHQFAKYDAMDLVPYMCATDDVVSDQSGAGLRRTGTIALGAHQCDFRYGSRSEPKRVADHFPEKIRIRPRGERARGAPETQAPGP